MDKDIRDTITKFENLGIIDNYKLILDEKTMKKVLKRDLMNHINYLDMRFPKMFETQKKSDESFFSKISRKNKTDIFDIINYYVENRNVKISYNTKIKGTSYPELVNVYIRKTVNKIIK